MTKLRHASKIIANNPVILQQLSFDMFETYKYMCDKILKSNKYRAFSDVLHRLYENHSHHVENNRKKKGLSPSKKGKKNRRSQRNSKTVEKAKYKGVDDNKVNKTAINETNEDLISSKRSKSSAKKEIPAVLELNSEEEGTQLGKI